MSLIATAPATRADLKRVYEDVVHRFEEHHHQLAIKVKALQHHRPLTISDKILLGELGKLNF